jgi:hypothetical protein
VRLRFTKYGDQALDARLDEISSADSHDTIETARRSSVEANTCGIDIGVGVLE